MNTEKKINPLVESLRATIAHAEAKHAEIFERDQPIGNYTYVGTRWSESILKGSGFGGSMSTAFEAVKGFWSPCAHEIGGCGGCGYLGGADQRSACGVCEGAGRILSVAGVAFLNAIACALAPEAKPDARPEALAEHNRVAAERTEAREKAQREQQERVAKERAIYGEAQRALDELRNGPQRALDDADHARRVHEAHNAPKRGA